MNLLLINITESKKDYIVGKCIKNDVGVFSADSGADVHKYLVSKQITHIFIDLVSKTTDWMEFLKQLRETEDGAKYQLIVMSNRKEREFIQALLYLGIVGFIQPDLAQEKTFEKLDSIMKISDKRDKRRMHFRVNITPKDDVRINFKPGKIDKLINARVTDLSIVALAFQLDNPKEYLDFADNDTIDKVQLKINNRFALLTIKILKAGPVTVATIVNPSDNALNLLTQFIFEAMSRLESEASANQ